MRSKKTVTISGFGGIDASKSPLEIAEKRSPSTKNFYLDDGGRFRKRQGTKQLLTLDGGKVNGIFHYRAQFGQTTVEHTIVQAGKDFYRIDDAEGIKKSVKITGIKVDKTLIADGRSAAYMRGDRLYVVCGDLIVYGSWDEGTTFEFRRVYADEDTYIPTVSIRRKPATYTFDPVVIEEESSLDDINLMTPRMKNTFQSNELTMYKYSEATQEYYLNTDFRYVVFGGIDEGADVKVTLPWGRVEEEHEAEEQYDAPEGEIVLSTSALQSVVTRNAHKVRDIYDEDGRCYGTVDYTDGCIILVSNAMAGEVRSATIYYNDLLPSGTLYGICPYMYSGGILFEDMIIEYAYTVTGGNGFVPYAERVVGCTTSVIFGIDGALDRLFVSGNKKLKNVDFYSESDDFTYFPDTGTVTMGSDTAGVTGYVLLSDSTLAIFKERINSEPTVYYRTGKYSTITETSGTESLIPVFTTVSGNVGEESIAGAAICDFGGDPLIVSRNGVFGIVFSENIKTADRYTRERSVGISPLIKAEEGLADAVGYSYGGRYYLAVGNTVYVADSRRRYTPAASQDNAWCYEWFLLDGIAAHVFGEIDGNLAFGDRSGSLFVFDDIRSDRTCFDIGNAEYTVSIQNNSITVSSGKYDAINDGDGLLFEKRGYYDVVCVPVSMSGGRCFVAEGRIGAVIEGKKLLCDAGTSGLTEEYYIIDDFDAADGSFILKDEEGETATPIDTSFRLLHPIYRSECFIKKIEGGDPYRISLERTPNGVPIVIGIKNGEAPTNAFLRLYRENPICAEWYSKILSLGSSIADKVLEGVSIVPEVGIPGAMRFGYTTKNTIASASLMERAETGAVGETGGFDFAKMDFSEFSFSWAFARSYTERVYDRGVNFLQFRVKSDSTSDCAFVSVTAIFKIMNTKWGD